MRTDRESAEAVPELFHFAELSTDLPHKLKLRSGRISLILPEANCPDERVDVNRERILTLNGTVDTEAALCGLHLVSRSTTTGPPCIPEPWTEAIFTRLPP
jgi:hypothetical protein